MKVLQESGLYTNLWGIFLVTVEGLILGAVSPLSRWSWVIYKNKQANKQAKQTMRSKALTSVSILLVGMDRGIEMENILKLVHI